MHRSDRIFLSVFPPKFKDHSTPTPLATPNLANQESSEVFGGAINPGAERTQYPANIQVRKNLAWSTATRFLSLQDKLHINEIGLTRDQILTPPETRDAIDLLINTRSTNEDGYDLINWFEVEVQGHFLKSIKPQLRQIWAEPIPRPRAQNALSRTAAILQSALGMYEMSFVSHIVPSLAGRTTPLGEPHRIGAAHAPDREISNFIRHLQDMVLSGVPTHGVANAITRVTHEYAFRAFCLGKDVPTSETGEEATADLLALLKNLQAAGLGDALAQKAFALAMNQLLTDFVSSSWVKVDWTTQQSVVPRLKTWIEHGFTPFISTVLRTLGSSEDEVDAAAAYLEDWQRMATERLGQARVKNLFDFVIRWPHSTGGIRDLKEYTTTPAARAYVTRIFEEQVENRMLHAGASTSHILDVYVLIIKVFYELDPKGVLLERVDRHIRKYLRSREDTAKTIVASLLVDPDVTPGVNPHAEYSQEIAKQMLRPISSFQGTQPQHTDWDDMEWTPDPIDADPSSRERSSDITAHLFSLYEKEEFINELRTILGEHLLRTGSSTTLEKETHLLELFKFHLGDEKMQACEVMLHDIENSRRLNTAIHRSDLYQGPIHHAQLDATILSQFFWPALREDEFTVPEPIAVLQEQYAQAFTSIKDMRKLQWLPALGKVDVELELQDRKVVETVQPWQASVIWAFNSSNGNTVTRKVSEFVEMLHMDESLVRSSLRFWMNARVLRETAPDSDEFTVIENLSELEAAIAPDAATGAADADAGSAIKTQEDQFNEKAELYKNFILGMLTNQGAMPAMKISMMLKMVFPGGFPFSDDLLKLLLGNMVDEGKVIRQPGDVYTLTKGQ